MNDKHGRNYDELIRLQESELAQWKCLLRPEVYRALRDWTEIVNHPTDTSRELHTCPVGCELHHWLMEFNPLLT